MSEPQLPLNVEAEVAFLELAMRSRGFTPNADALSRVRRMLTGTLTLDAARAEVLRKYGHGPQRDSAG
ncbi:hypothetical protein ACRQ4C_01430 [Curtobacterium sp. SP.BCp]|uniref:hypothetical protein n=1 Tax=Curtobacterium sp. SP.BCp TaxID=3435230 RepID=UPI003F73D98C